MRTKTIRAALAAICVAAALPSWAANLTFNVAKNATTNVAEVIGADVGDVIKTGEGTLILSSGANAFTGNLVINAGLVVADFGTDIPSTAEVTVSTPYVGGYGPRTQSTITLPIGTGAGHFNPANSIRTTAYEKNLTLNFGGAAEALTPGSTEWPNGYLRFNRIGNNCGSYTFVNPIVIGGAKALDFSYDNYPAGKVVDFTGGITAASGVGNLDHVVNMGTYRFSSVGALDVPTQSLSIKNNGAIMLDGGTHSFYQLRGYSGALAITNANLAAGSDLYLGRSNVNNVFNIFAKNSAITFGGATYIGHDSSATCNFYMDGGTLDVTGNLGIGMCYSGSGSKGNGFFRLNGGTVRPAAATYIGYQAGYNGRLRVEDGTFAEAPGKTFYSGVSGTGTVEVVGGNLTFGEVFFGNGTGGLGRLRMSGGTLSNVSGTSKNFYISANNAGRGEGTVTGGKFTDINGQFIIGLRTGGFGRLDMSGGEFRCLASDTTTQKTVGYSGTGVLSVASSAIFSTSNTFTLAWNNNAAGTIELYEGGVMEARQLDFRAASAFQKLTADGGTFRVAANGGTFAFFVNPQNLDESYVDRRGVTFDVGNNNVTAGNFALDGQSPGAIRKTGCGTLTLSGLPQTHKGLEVNEGTLALSSGAAVGAAYAPTTDGDAGNIYPANPSDALLENNYLLHRWSFTGGNLEDSIGGATPIVYGFGDDETDEVTCWERKLYLPGTAAAKRGTKCVNMGGNLFGTEDGPFTIEFWARCDDSGHIFVMGNSKYYDIAIHPNGQIVARVESGGVVNPGIGASTYGTFYHYSVVFGAPAQDGTRDITFRRKDVTTGTTLGEYTYTASTFSPITYQSAFWFGNSWHGENSDRKMAIDEVRIWRAALSDAQLTANVVRGPDELPLLGFKPGSGPAKIAAGATFDLGGNTISYPGIEGAGTVRNGTITVETLNVTGAMRLEGDVTVTGELIFAEGASLVTTGTLNVAGTTVRYTQPISVHSIVLATTDGGGSITGIPAAVDLGANRGYRLSVTSSAIKISKLGMMVIVK